MSFDLSKLVLREVRIPFRFTFKHSLAERREANNLFLSIHSATGHVGYGEVLPRPYLTGETIESSWTDVSERWWPAVRSLTLPRSAPPTTALRPVYLEADQDRKTGSYAGVDVAIHDLWGRVTDTPGARLFGQSPERQWLTCPLGGGGVRSVKWIGRLARIAGWRDYKLKVGRPDDVLRTRVARSVIGTHSGLRVDANAGWTVEQSLAIAADMKRFGVSSLEQPVPADDLSGMARIQRDAGMDVMADESLCSRADAEALIEADAARLWNVRLAKVGGFTGFIEMLELAKRAGVRVHHGVLVGESAVLTAAARACAGLADFAHVEYGFPGILLKSQPFRHGPGGLLGKGRPLGSAPGLGVEPDDSVIERATVRKIELT